MKKLILSFAAIVAAFTVSAQSVTDIYNQGATAYGAKDFKTAVEAFEQVVVLGMDSEVEGDATLAATAKTLVPKCYYQLGGRAMQAKDIDGAIEYFSMAIDKAILVDDTNTESKAINWIGKCYKSKGGTFFNNKDYAAAAEIFAKGYEFNKKDAEMANFLGTCYCELGNYAEGLEILNKVALNPNPKYEVESAKAKELVALYTNNMVAGFQQSGDFDGMIAVAEQMLAKDPASAAALKIRVQAYDGKKDLSKVIELAEEAALAQSSEEDKSYLYYLLGSAYNAREMKPQAIAALKKVTTGPTAEAAAAAVAELSK